MTGANSQIRTDLDHLRQRLRTQRRRMSLALSCFLVLFVLMIPLLHITAERKPLFLVRQLDILLTGLAFLWTLREVAYFVIELVYVRKTRGTISKISQLE